MREEALNPAGTSHSSAGRGEALPTCGDVEENPGPVVLTHFCPFAGCSRAMDGTRRGWADEKSARQHVQSVHVSANMRPPDEWLTAYGLRICTTCKCHVRQGRPCPGPQCTLYQIRAGSLEAGDPRSLTTPPTFAASLTGNCHGDAALQTRAGLCPHV